MDPAHACIWLRPDSRHRRQPWLGKLAVCAFGTDRRQNAGAGSAGAGLPGSGDARRSSAGDYPRHPRRRAKGFAPLGRRVVSAGPAGAGVRSAATRHAGVVDRHPGDCCRRSAGRTHLRHPGRNRPAALVERGTTGGHRAGQRILADDLGSSALAATLHAGRVSASGGRRGRASVACLHCSVRMAAGRPCDHHGGGLRYLHMGGFWSDHCFDGRPAATDAGEGGLSAAIFHRADQWVGLARPFVSAQPAGDSLRRLRQECAYRRAVCGRLCSRPSDGIDGFGVGRVARHPQWR